MNHNTKVYELIQEFPKIIPDEYCDILIKWFLLNDHLHQEGQVYGGHATGDDFANAIVLDKKKTTQAYPDKGDPISDVMTKIIQTAYGKYSEMHPTPISQPMCVRDYSVRVYNKGDGYFKKHCDQTAGANVHRVFGFIGYLNDVEDGGGTEFDVNWDYMKEHDINPKKFIMFTDGYPWGSWGDENYCDTVFIIHGNNTIVPPFGAHAYYEFKD